MGRKNLAFAVVAMVTVFLVSGCSTVPKKFKEEVSGIKSKVDTLDSRVGTVESKQAESERMVSQQSQTIEELRAQREKMVTTNISTRSAAPVRVRGHVKEIQICLQNAGFYKGKLDGVKGKSTKKAIKEFQKANGLKADGKVGPKTWELLSKYSAAGAQAGTPVEAAGGAQEGATK